MTQSKRQKRLVSGWVVLNKPYDMTSTQAVGKVRWLYGAAKAGHAGTLDPLATGILPIALGEATKTVPQVQDGRKVYRFTVKWGEATATDDAEGAIVATSDIRPTKADIERITPDFVGEITQVPPAFSAIKIAGERAYDLARAGEMVAMAPRRVVVESLRLLSQSEDRAEFETACQKGTYVRALARDMAEALGTKGHVVALHRAAVGPFLDTDAVTIEALESADLSARDALLKPVSAGLAGLPELRVTPEQAAAIRHGNPVLLLGAGAPAFLEEAWASFRGEAVAVGPVENGQFKPRRVIN